MPQPLEIITAAGDSPSIRMKAMVLISLGAKPDGQNEDKPVYMWNETRDLSIQDNINIFDVSAEEELAFRKQVK